MTVIDTNSNVAGSLDDLKQRGVTTVGRYYSTKAWKRLTHQEAVAISQAGLSLFVVFEDSGDPTLTHDSGVHDAQLALTQAQAVGQPPGSAIYFALEHLPSGYETKHLAGIRLYIAGVRSVIDGHYKIGVYSDGVVCDALLTEGLCDYAWISASRGFPGSKAFYASGKWALAQDPHIDQTWGGLSVDLNEAKADFGGFRVASLATGPGGEADAATAPVLPGFVQRACDLAGQEWTFFGKQTYDIAGHKDHAGHVEGEEGFYQRIGRYWVEGTNTHGIDGRNHESPWSAAFISWVMKTAGAQDRFRYSIRHSHYIAQGIRDFLQKREAAGYWTQRLGEALPVVGDIVCWSRESGVDYDHQKGGEYAGHTDLIVAVEPSQVWVVGGNVGNSVTRRPLKRDASGHLVATNAGGEILFGIMKCRIA